jgi:hypothetical protein
MLVPQGLDAMDLYLHVCIPGVLRICTLNKQPEGEKGRLNIFGALRETLEAPFHWLCGRASLLRQCFEPPSTFSAPSSKFHFHPDRH